MAHVLYNHPSLERRAIKIHADVFSRIATYSQLAEQAVTRLGKVPTDVIKNSYKKLDEYSKESLKKEVEDLLNDSAINRDLKNNWGKNHPLVRKMFITLSLYNLLKHGPIPDIIKVRALHAASEAIKRSFAVTSRRWKDLDPFTKEQILRLSYELSEEAKELYRKIISDLVYSEKRVLERIEERTSKKHFEEPVLEMGLPLVLHVTNAHPEVIQIVRGVARDSARAFVNFKMIESLVRSDMDKEKGAALLHHEVLSGLLPDVETFMTLTGKPSRYLVPLNAVVESLQEAYNTIKKHGLHTSSSSKEIEAVLGRLRDLISAGEEEALREAERAEKEVQ